MFPLSTKNAESGFHMNNYTSQAQSLKRIIPANVRLECWRRTPAICHTVWRRRCLFKRGDFIATT